MENLSNYNPTFHQTDNGKEYISLEVSLPMDVQKQLREEAEKHNQNALFVAKKDGGMMVAFQDKGGKK